MNTAGRCCKRLAGLRFVRQTPVPGRSRASASCAQPREWLQQLLGDASVGPARVRTCMRAQHAFEVGGIAVAAPDVVEPVIHAGDRGQSEEAGELTKWLAAVAGSNASSTPITMGCSWCLRSSEYRSSCACSQASTACGSSSRRWRSRSSPKPSASKPSSSSSCPACSGSMACVTGSASEVGCACAGGATCAIAWASSSSSSNP